MSAPKNLSDFEPELLEQLREVCGKLYPAPTITTLSEVKQLADGGFELAERVGRRRIVEDLGKAISASHSRRIRHVEAR